MAEESTAYESPLEAQGISTNARDDQISVDATILSSKPMGPGISYNLQSQT